MLLLGRLIFLILFFALLNKVLNPEGIPLRYYHNLETRQERAARVLGEAVAEIRQHPERY
jgi:hypothetical protein